MRRWPRGFGDLGFRGNDQGGRKKGLRLASRRLEKFFGVLQMASPVGDGARRLCAAAPRKMSSSDFVRRTLVES